MFDSVLYILLNVLNRYDSVKQSNSEIIKL